MGDYCQIELVFKTSDYKLFNDVYQRDYNKGIKIGANGDLSSMDGESILVEEMNYGGYELIEALTTAQLTFYGFKGAGNTYQAMVFACYYGTFIEIDADNDCNPVVSIYRSNGVIEPPNMEDVIKFYELQDKVIAYIKNET